MGSVLISYIHAFILDISIALLQVVATQRR